MNDDLDEMGPVDYLVVEFPGSRMNGEMLPELLSLVDRGLVRVIDLIFVTKDADGQVTVLDLEQVDAAGDLDVTLVTGASSGVLGEDDIDDAGSVLEPGSSAAVLVYENTWAAPFATAVRRSGGQLVASGRIPVQALLASLDAAEAS